MKNNIIKAIVFAALLAVMPLTALAEQTSQEDILTEDQKFLELAEEHNSIFKDLADKIKQGKEISKGMNNRIHWLAEQGIETGLLKRVHQFFVASILEARDYLLQAKELREGQDVDPAQVHELLEKTREKLFLAHADMVVFEGVFQNSIPEN